MSDLDDVDYFTDTSLVDDPFGYFEHLRAKGAACPLPHHGVVAVTGFDAATEVWSDPDTFSSCVAVTGPFPKLPDAPHGADYRVFVTQHRGRMPMSEYLITQDPPTHSATRGLLMRLLTPKRLKENEEFIWRLADQQLDEIIGRPSFDFLREFAQPYALTVIADLLGVPESNRTAFRAKLGHGDRGSREEAAKDPLGFLHETFTAYVEDRRREPRDDVLTGLASATYPDGSLPEVAEVVRTATFLFAAGQDTTARLMTAAVRLLCDVPELQDSLRSDRSRISVFLEEVLRLDGPVKTVSRLACVDTSVAGVEVPAGTVVSILPHAANRDPAHFGDPDSLRFDRPNARTHVAFGRGNHTCPGAPLARVEARAGLDRLLARTSEIRLDETVHGPRGSRHYSYEPTYILRGLRGLQVVLSS